MVTVAQDAEPATVLQHSPLLVPLQWVGLDERLSDTGYDCVGDTFIALVEAVAV